MLNSADITSENFILSDEPDDGFITVYGTYLPDHVEFEVSLVEDSQGSLEIEDWAEMPTEFEDVWEEIEDLILQTFSKKKSYRRKDMKKKSQEDMGQNEIDLSVVIEATKDLLNDNAEEYLNALGGDSLGYNADAETTDGSSYDGFISFTNGSASISDYENLNIDSSYWPNSPTAAKEIERQVDMGYEQAQDWFKEEYPEIVEQLGEDKINYHDLYDEGLGDKAEELSMAEMESNSEEGTMYQIQVLFQAPDSSYTYSEGNYSAAVQAVVNWETPYFRPGKGNEVSGEIIVIFDSEEDALQKIEAAIPQAIAECNSK